MPITVWNTDRTKMKISHFLESNFFIRNFVKIFDNIKGVGKTDNPIKRGLKICFSLTNNKKVYENPIPGHCEYSYTWATSGFVHFQHW